MHYYYKVIYARDYIRSKTNLVPTIGIILGMETVINFDFLEQKRIIPASSIPFFPSYFLENQHKELTIRPSLLDLNDLYNENLMDRVKIVAYNNDIPMNEGILTWLTGPSFETPTEISALKQLGADAVFSALVPWAIVLVTEV
ncbi:Purine nucleoside phosphorylase protein [Haloplasma contractile SSD-17B]|uniref:purine-nucleoside phosphorylase n=2 Tax=Haloplasma TaxID=471824 RepID=F7PUB4_9MOLU|nr:Purine nucleoside phosphorylase protein [Haloplasma contractile SSD-17B]